MIVSKSVAAGPITNAPGNREKQNVKFYINNSEQIDETDEGQGESKLTQRQIDKILGMTHNMFKHVMALNTYTEPFLAMRQHDQRNLIEELLGITL